MRRAGLFIFVCWAAVFTMTYERDVCGQDKAVMLHSLNPDSVLTVLDLDRPGLERVKAASVRGDRNGALSELLRYYRARFPLKDVPSGDSTKDFTTADNIVRHIFQWGPYEPADYGADIDWEWDPRGDIEWVAAVYRFYWAPPLEKAYRATGDEKYASVFVELTSDWIAKHPLEKRDMVHPVYTSWRGFPWLDIQTGIRATNLCMVFKTMVHAKAFTPEFLGIFLASMYDHQVKTEMFPMGIVHNKAIFEQRGFVNVAWTFPEFRDTRRWMELALERTEYNLLAQTTADGVQREWSAGYHLGVLRDAVEIMEHAESMGITVSGAYRDRVRLMYDYIFAAATPDLGWAMFGDVSRPRTVSGERSRWPLYGPLLKGTELFGDPKYAARARLDRANLPEQTSYAFPEAGMYVLRSEWGPEQVYFALHCSPPPLSGHDQQDNGTFELYAYGRWLMTDTGFYTYGHDPEKRAWHRQTQVHQTMTLNGENSKVDGKLLLWHSGDDADAVVVENPSYGSLIHRRTVWFVDRSFFVLLDEAIGDTTGVLDLHFQLAAGPARIDSAGKRAMTSFDDANVLVWTSPDAPLTVHEEEGWFAWEYGSREPRKAFRFQHDKTASVMFLTLLVPYRGKEAPGVSAELAGNFKTGDARAVVAVSVGGSKWEIGRDIEKQAMWCIKK